MRLTIYGFSAILLLFSCEEMPDKETSNLEDRTLIIDTVSENINIQKVNSNKQTELNEKQFSAKSNFGDIKITVAQEEHNILVSSETSVVEDLTSVIVGNVTDFIETDVNADGFNEFYAITNAGDVVAYTSYRNKSYGEIYIPVKPYKIYKNIQELKSWEVKDSMLLLTFAVGELQELNTVRYLLAQGEANYILKVE